MFKTADSSVDHDRAVKFYGECQDKIRIMNREDKKLFVFNLFSNSVIHHEETDESSDHKKRKRNEFTG